MPIQFDEISADIAPPAAPAETPAATPAAAPVDADALQQWRDTLALLREREARLWTD